MHGTRARLWVKMATRSHQVNSELTTRLNPHDQITVGQDALDLIEIRFGKESIALQYDGVTAGGWTVVAGVLTGGGRGDAECAAGVRSGARSGVGQAKVV